MVEKKELMTRGGVYLARLDPSKASEIRKIRPVVILSSQTILEIRPPIVFICPLSSRSYPDFSALHLKLPARDNLQVESFALVEHCRSITTHRLIFPRLAQLVPAEINSILHRLQRMLGL